jgi:hypothetical protein
MNRSELTEAIVAARLAKGLKWADIGSIGVERTILSARECSRSRTSVAPAGTVACGTSLVIESACHGAISTRRPIACVICADKYSLAWLSVFHIVAAAIAECWIKTTRSTLSANPARPISLTHVPLPLLLVFSSQHPS